MAAKKTKTIFGNYFSVSVQRLVPGTDLTDRVSATDGSIEGEIFMAGMIHNSEGSPEFIAYAGGKAIYEGAELDEAGEAAIAACGKTVALSDNETNELMQIFCIQDDADYDLDSDAWTYEIGNGGDISLEGDYDNALIVNVSPFYEVAVELTGDFGDVVYDEERGGSDGCAEHHEFCGALK